MGPRIFDLVRPRHIVPSEFTPRIWERSPRRFRPRIQWQRSYVADDKIYCVYVAESEKDILEHAKQGGFPANRINAVRAIIDPTTAE